MNWDGRKNEMSERKNKKGLEEKVERKSAGDFTW